MRLKDIGAEMAVQNNRATQFPLYAIEENIRRGVSYHDDWDGAERKEDYSYKKLCERCQHAEDTQNPYLDYCEDCDSDTFYYYKDDTRLAIEAAGVFLTAKACQEHIDNNAYHYDHPRVYGIGAWRNPEMQKVMQHLIKQSGNSVPHYYL